MKINILIEGGIGDLILAMRFVQAVREEYLDAYLQIFINNDNNKIFNSFIQKHWGYLWNEVKTVSRVSSNYIIQSQFGKEVYNAALSNIDPEQLKDLYNCGKFYNFHLDSLKFLEYSDIPWQKYLKCVPPPKNVDSAPLKYHKKVVLNLYARQNHFSYIPKEKANIIISSLRDKYDLLILAPTEDAVDEFYSEHRDITVATDLSESLAIIKTSLLGLSIDSGLRCMFYAFGKACYTMCGLCTTPFQIPISHSIRWYPWKEHLIPVQSSSEFITNLIGNSLKNSACQVYSEYHSDDIDNALIKRKYD